MKFIIEHGMLVGVELTRRNLHVTGCAATTETAANATKKRQ